MSDMYIEGYAIVYNARTTLYEYEGKKYYEIISSTALDGCDISDVVLRYNHSDQVFVLASTKNGTLELMNDSKGLKIRAKLANTTVGRDLYEMIKEKYCSKMSFAFIIGEDEFDIKSRTRIINKFKRIIDTSVVDMPAYPQTSVYVLDEAQLSNQRELKVMKEQMKERMRLSDLEHEKKLLKRKMEMQELKYIKDQIRAKGR